MDFPNDIIKDLLVKAYKKLKSSVFFDKTQLVLRNKIVAYEASPEFDKNFEKLIKKITSGNLDEIIKKISFLVFPKNIACEKEKCFISNLDNDITKVEDLQYFIDMDVEGYILGILWLILIGNPLDELVYEHSYGNRIRKNLLDEEGSPTRSPYLFQPYFSQYESWRDTALNYAQKSLDKNQDVVVLMLDFKRFFYQVGLSEDEFFEIVYKVIYKNNHSQAIIEIISEISNFVWKVIEKYSEVLRNHCYDLVEDRIVLPIGFHPSNVIANIALKKFDDTLINGWNPIYYGRYVDDIIIVEKIEKNSKIYKKAQDGVLKADDVIEYYLTFCNAWQKNEAACNSKSTGGLLVKLSEDESKKYFEDKTDEIIYKVNHAYNQFSKSEIIVQKDKVKIFYFDSKKSDALIKCFKDQIIKNKSEFRFLPEDEAVFQDSDYTEIYHLTNHDGPNKLRGIDGLSIDKFNLSKFLGKYMRISGLVNDEKECTFENNIDKIFTPSVLIENYLMWEKVLEIFIINEKYSTYLKFIKQIISSIEKIDLAKSYSNDKTLSKLQNSLVQVLSSAILRTSSLVWGPDVKCLIQKIYDTINDHFILLNFENVRSFNETRKMYCITRMCDKYAMPILIDCVLRESSVFEDNTKLNLCNFNDIINVIKNYELMHGDTYDFYPYLITLADLNFHNQIRDLIDGSFNISATNLQQLTQQYIKINYCRDLLDDDSVSSVFEVKVLDDEKSNLAIKVGNKKKSKIKIAIANTSLYESDIEAVLSGKPRRDFCRYENLVKVVNSAIKERVDFLVLPENYLPFEWIPILTRTCAKNQLAIISGVEHIKNNNVVTNLTTTILPYEEDNYKFAYAHFHKKVNMALGELEKIHSYRCKENEGNNYELYNWNDFWFSVYCCYELASIKDRSLFQSHIDALIAVEWNKDVNYYSNIVESLSRDLHCFCIQVNASKYGDSRITIPSKTENKDKIKVKGGCNTSLLVDELDFTELRRFQYQGVLLQTKGKNPNLYKQTPPDFKYEIVGDKISGNLWNKLKTKPLIENKE